ncbi:hypothetical protein [Nocardioides sp. LML1-1-1.1]|uniref:hypothetical protein n=1 Tax=Nocardioides sp. LML1-1-1.1 TaxID=3135248 RepID=UPI0034208E46
MLFLLDSNIAIKSDPLSAAVEPDAALAMEFHRLATTHNHGLRVHVASLDDFGRIKDPAKRSARLTVFKRYERIVNPPVVSESQRTQLGTPTPGSNDDVDQRLLAAVVGHAVGYLVTQDQGIHSMAHRLGVGDRVLTLADALAFLRNLHPAPPTPPPAVRRIKAHELRLGDPIFDGLRADYGDTAFDTWFLEKAAQGGRDALLIDGQGEAHAAIALLKAEPNGEHGIQGPLLKISTFKVAQTYSGQKYGELLLKAIFEQAHRESMAGIFVTAFPKQQALINLLDDFGFQVRPVRTGVGELVLAKDLRRHLAPSSMDPLAYHVRHGPPALRMAAARSFLVPIEPRWHQVLFPDAEPLDPQGGLFPALLGHQTQPFGNALRKAYLCNSPTRLLMPGSPLLFYRSRDEKAVYVVGVCEQTYVSRDPAEIASLVGRRTVYSYSEIEDLARLGEVLVVLFRQDRVLREDPITLEDLRREGVSLTWPQTITRTRPEGAKWLQQRLDA